MCRFSENQWLSAKHLSTVNDIQPGACVVQLLLAVLKLIKAKVDMLRRQLPHCSAHHPRHE